MKTYSPQTVTLATNVILEAAVRKARYRLAAVPEPREAYEDNARTLLVAASAVELIEDTATDADMWSRARADKDYDRAEGWRS